MAVRLLRRNRRYREAVRLALFPLQALRLALTPLRRQRTTAALLPKLGEFPAPLVELLADFGNVGRGCVEETAFASSRLRGGRVRRSRLQHGARLDRAGQQCGEHGRDFT